jgi:hypothetical protein
MLKLRTKEGASDMQASLARCRVLRCHVLGAGKTELRLIFDVPASRKFIASDNVADA